jgi:hypothetical protein
MLYESVPMRVACKEVLLVEHVQGKFLWKESTIGLVKKCVVPYQVSREPTREVCHELNLVHE